MKNITIFLFVFLIAVVKAQTVSDYKYIVIPAEFNDFKDNKAYGLSNLLEKSLKAKKYTVLPATKSEWPSDALMNPCGILNAELLNIPKSLGEFVLVHEIVHRLVPNHGMLFKSFLFAYMPDWQERERSLRSLERERIEQK